MDIRLSLKREMERKGLNEYKLAKLSGVPQPTVHRLLSGETKYPRAQTLRSLARTLGSSSDQILANSHRPVPSTSIREDPGDYAPALRLTEAIESLIHLVPSRDRPQLRWLLTRLLNASPGTGSETGGGPEVKPVKG